MHRIVIVGGGFAGVWSALAAAHTRLQLGRGPSDVVITLVSRDRYLTLRPRLYEANPDGLRVPLDTIFGAGAGVELVEGEATTLDPAARTVTVGGRDESYALEYDQLVLAAGSRLVRPPAPGVAEHAFSVDTHAEAVALDRHLASLGARPAAPGRFTAVVVGAGFTGLEVATELVGRLRALAAASGAGEGEAAVVLVERADVVGPELGPGPRPAIEQALRELGVATRLRSGVEAIRPDGVRLTGGEWVAAHTAVWAGGLRASALTAQIPAERDELGRLGVDQYLRVRGVEGVIAAGDVARAMADGEHAALMSCQHAIPMGEVAGHNAAALVLGHPPVAYAQPDYVTCLDLGPWGAIFTRGWERRVTLTGFWAKMLKQSINTRLIYPPTAGEPAVAAA